MHTRIQHNIKELRSRSKLTSKELSERIGKNPYAISSYETGKSTPPLEVIYQLAEIFQVSPAALISEDLTDPETYQRVTSGNYRIPDGVEEGQLVKEKQLLYKALKDEEALRKKSGQKLDKLRQQLKALEADLANIPENHPAYDRIRQLREILEK